MKKLIALLLSFAMMGTLAACGSGSGSKPAASVSEPAASGSGSGPSSSAAEVKWPASKTVQIYVPFASGGNSDLTARLFAQKLTSMTGSNFVIVNQAAGGGATCYNTVKSAKADGSVLGWATPSWFTSYFSGTHDCDPLNDFSTLAVTTGLSAYYIIVPKNSQFNTLKDLVDYCKANPGKLVFGMQMGSMSHYFAESFAQICGIKLGYVETGSGDAVRVTAIMGNTIQATLVNGAQAQQYYEAGELKCLASIFDPGDTAPESMKDIPTLEKCGYKNVDVPNVTFLFGPKMDEALSRKINEVFTEAFNQSDVQSKLNEMNQPMSIDSSYDDTIKDTKKIYDSYHDVAKILGTLTEGR